MALYSGRNLQWMDIIIPTALFVHMFKFQRKELRENEMDLNLDLDSSSNAKQNRTFANFF